MKLHIVVEIEPGEDPGVVRGAANDWVDSASRHQDWTRGEALVEALVSAGINVSEANPDIAIIVEP